MKKMFSLLLAMMMLLTSAVALADGAETSKAIAFSGYKFGDTFANIRKDMKLGTIEFMYGQRNARVIGDALSDMAERDLPDSNKTSTCFFARPSGYMGKVAGYDAEVKLWFVYPVQDGIIISNEADALFYAGCYEFNWNDVVSTHTDLKGKLETLYGSPFYAGSDLNDVFGELPLKENTMNGYNDDAEKFKPTYTVWKSSANGGYAVLAFWFNTNENQYKLKLTYISNCADEAFSQMADMGLFGDGFSSVGDTGFEGL